MSEDKMSDKARIRNRMHDDLLSWSRMIENELLHYKECFSPTERAKITTLVIDMRRMVSRLENNK